MLVILCVLHFAALLGLEKTTKATSSHWPLRRSKRFQAAIDYLFDFLECFYSRRTIFQNLRILISQA